jgi:hypothetical protein
MDAGRLVVGLSRVGQLDSVGDHRVPRPGGGQASGRRFAGQLEANIEALCARSHDGELAARAGETHSGIRGLKGNRVAEGLNVRVSS